MDFLSWFFVESRVFELSVPAGGSVLRLLREAWAFSSYAVGKYSVAWLKKVVEKLVHLVEDFAFVDFSREGNRAFIAQKGSNRACRFLEVAEYAVCGCRGLIIVPEGCEGHGWKILADELGKVMAVFDSSLCKVHGVRSQIHFPFSMGKELEVPLVIMMPSSVGGVKGAPGPGGNGPTVEGIILRLQRWCVWWSLSQPIQTPSMMEAVRCPGPLGKDFSVAEPPLGQKSGHKA